MKTLENVSSNKTKDFTANFIHLKYLFASLLKTFVSLSLNIKSNFWRPKLRYPWYIASIFNWVFESLTLIETEGVWWWCDGGLKSPSNSLRQDLLLWPGVFVSWGLFFEMGYKGDSLKWIQSVSPINTTISSFKCVHYWNSLRILRWATKGTV